MLVLWVISFKSMALKYHQRLMTQIWISSSGFSELFLGVVEWNQNFVHSSELLIYVANKYCHLVCFFSSNRYLVSQILTLYSPFHWMEPSASQKPENFVEFLHLLSFYWRVYLCIDSWRLDLILLMFILLFSSFSSCFVGDLTNLHVSQQVIKNSLSMYHDLAPFFFPV